MILNALLTIPISFIYNKIYENFKLTQNMKIANSFTSVTHVSFNIFLSILYFCTNKYSILIQLNSGGYYLYDSYYIIQKKNFDLLRIMYLYHHITIFMYILLDPNEFNWIYTLFFAELSNIPNYIVYYNLQLDKKLKLKDKSPSTIFYMKIQFYFYAIIRIFFIGYFGFLDLLHDDVPYIIYMTSILYVFGLIWFSFMFNQYVKLIKNN